MRLPFPAPSAVVVTLTLAVVTNCLASETETDHYNTFAVEKPLVFDLLRGVAGHKGDQEVSYLLVKPLIPSNQSHLLFEPEFETVVADGVAVRVELETTEKDLKGIKLAQQFTLLSERDRGIGVQSHAFLGHGGHFVFETVLVTSKRVGPFSNLLVLGGNMAGDESHLGSAGPLVMDALFFSLSPKVWVGLEVYAFYDFAKGRLSLSAYPQVHLYLHKDTVVMFGYGLEAKGSEQWVPKFAHRIIIRNEA